MLTKKIICTILLTVSILLTGCKEKSNPTEPEHVTTLEITSIQPEEGSIGTSVTITGSGFSSTTSANKVTFSGVEALVQEASEAELNVIVPDGADTGPIIVEVEGESVTGSVFTIKENTPGITSIEPEYGVAGTEVTIIGINFSPNPTENTIHFGDIEADVINAAETELVTKVPEEAEDGPVVVTVAGESVTGPVFTVEAGEAGDDVSELHFVQATDDAGFPIRRGNTSVVFNNKMWVIGGWDNNNYFNDVWRSDDGILWEKVSDDAGFRARRGHTSVVYDGAIWVIGGYVEDGIVNDVWRSNDGETWTEVTSGADFSARWDHTSIVFEDHMWVIGGAGTVRDIWNSSDGETWNKVTDNGRASEGSFTTVILNNEMLDINGLNATRVGEVRKSSDGISWEEVTDKTEFSGRSGYTSVVHNDEVWLVAGNSYFGSGFLNDVWHSSDGKNWNQVISEAEFQGRNSHSSLIFDGALWVIGGSTIRGISNDVWYMKLPDN